jgi:hypothetical protein
MWGWEFCLSVVAKRGSDDRVQRSDVKENILTFWNSGALSFSSRTITLIGTSTKLSFSELPPVVLT